MAGRQDTTHDSISLRGAGVVHVEQPATGHRFTLDSILLADFCRIKARDRILEPGTGTGIISLLLARKFPSTSVTAVELQPPCFTLCRRNMEANSLAGRVQVIERDIRKLRGAIAPGSFDVIVVNPPYLKEGAGRASPHAGRRTARSAAPSLETWLDLRVFLRNKGRYNLVFPAARTAELLALMAGRGLEPKRLRCVHPLHDRPASLVLVEAVKAGGAGLEILPPLVLQDSAGVSTKELNLIYGLPPAS